MSRAEILRTQPCIKAWHFRVKYNLYLWTTHGFACVQCKGLSRLIASASIVIKRVNIVESALAPQPPLHLLATSSPPRPCIRWYID